MSNNIKVLIIGPGYMGREYSKVLDALEVEYDVLGRGVENAKKFEQQTGKNVICKSVYDYFEGVDILPTHVIVTPRVPQLKQVVVEVLNCNVKNILVEKPGGETIEDISEICKFTNEKKANVYVAYNRRFYSSTNKALDIIAEDGGIKSFNFEFTEWIDRIQGVVPERELNTLLVNNSGHVIDLAFFIGGNPVEMSTYRSGGCSWHKHGTIFSGAGVSEKNALFSYQANWESPGRWALEALTSKHRLYFKPMEKLQIQEKNSVEVNFVDVDDSLDIKYKPGLYRQVESFIYSIDDGKKKTIFEQLESMKNYYKIGGYL